MRKEEFDKHISNLNLQVPKCINFILDKIILKPFKPFGISKDYNFIPTLETPIELSMLDDKNLYRVIPRYPNLICSKNGIIRKFSGEKIKPILLGGYLRISVRPLYDGNIKLSSIHRLVALAWCNNISYIKYNIVDHKDGNKFNNNYDNLRWINNSKNISKSNNGIDFRWLVKNMRTGYVRRFISLSEIGVYLEMGKSMFSATRCPFIIKKSTTGFIVEDSLNFKGWLLEDEYDIYGNLYKYKVNDIKYSKTTLLSKVKNTNIKTINEAKKYFYNNKISFKTINSKHCRKVYAKDIKTNKELSFNNSSEVAKYFNVSLSAVNFRLNGYRNGRLLHDSWLLRRCGMIYVTPKEVYKQLPVEITLTKNNVKHIFNSLREVAKYLNRDRATIKKYMLSNSKLNGFLVSLTSDS